MMNRRRFFKKAAKGLLPMLGAFVAAPTILTTLTSCDKCDGCEAECRDNCEATCKGGCEDGCKGSCSDGCYGSCANTSGGGCSDCSSSCNNNCSSGCSGNSTSTTCSNCASSCSTGCSTGCTNSCGNGCASSCAEGCSTSCTGGCNTSCSNTCTGSATGKNSVSDASGSIDGYDYVDMGLSVKWARYNIGASTPEGTGSYFALGDPNGKIGNYYSDAENYYTKGKFSSNSSIAGTSYDTATKKWSSKWRLPTREEFQELVDNSTIKKYEHNSVKGFLLTSKKNNNSIFLPAAGSRYVDNNKFVASRVRTGHYWTANIYEYLVNSYSFDLLAYSFFFNYDDDKYGSTRDLMDQTKNSIRPVSTGVSSGGGSCSDCTSDCAIGCATGCSNGCSGGCAGDCAVGCTGECSGNCSGRCDSTCFGGCIGDCHYTCVGSCSGFMN